MNKGLFQIEVAQSSMASCFRFYANLYLAIVQTTETSSGEAGLQGKKIVRERCFTQPFLSDGAHIL